MSRNALRPKIAEIREKIIKCAFFELYIRKDNIDIDRVTIRHTLFYKCVYKDESVEVLGKADLLSKKSIPELIEYFLKCDKNKNELLSLTLTGEDPLTPYYLAVLLKKSVKVYKTKTDLLNI